MNYSKAWDELVQHQIPWITHGEDGPASEWYLDNGVKIEKFKDGTIELKYVYTQGDNYMDIPPHQARYFEDYGWFAGLFKVNQDYYSNKLIDLDDRIRAGEDLQDKYNDCEKELNSYKYKLREALKSVE